MAPNWHRATTKPVGPAPTMRTSVFLEGDEQRYASGFSIISLPLNGAKLKFQASALTVFGVFITIPNSFGPPATQLALAVICIGSIALALIESQRRQQPEPARLRSKDAKL
jgi:hypothetical protein